MTTSAAAGRDATGASQVAVYWRERLLDVRAPEVGEQGEPGARLEVGGLTYVFSAARPVEQVRRGWPTRRDLPFLGLVFGLLLAFGFAATLAKQHQDDGSGEDPLAHAAATMSRTVFHLPPRVEVVQARDKALDSHEQVLSQRPRSAHRPLQAAKAGMLGALDALGGSQVFERRGLDENISRSLERLSGAESADSQGLSGINARHGGSGGPGDSLRLGGIGSRHRAASGDNLLALAGLKKSVVEPDSKRIVVDTGLPRDVVAKIIARHQSEIRFCYEAELQKFPALGGKLAVLFTIDGSGAVAQADVAESSLDNATVEACVLSRIRRWKFPEPKGGAVVSVSYPWIFKRAGLEADEE